jgi:4-alpha-glucanotransferase
MNPPLPESDLRALAQAAGIVVDWHDAQGRARTVAADVLTVFLERLGLPAASSSQRADSAARLAQAPTASALLIGAAGQALRVQGQTGAAIIELDSGAALTVQAQPDDNGYVRIVLPDYPGYHRLVLGDCNYALAIAPARAPAIADLLGCPGARIWGPVAQLYSLRRHATTKNNAVVHGPTDAPYSAEAFSRPGALNGFGNFTALAELAQTVAHHGAHALAISPIHAMFAADPDRYSPYGPSSRLFLNTLYTDPTDLFGADAVDAAILAVAPAQVLSARDASPLIDWPASARTHHALLRRLYDSVTTNGSRPAWQASFERFIVEGDEALQRHACFEAMHAERARATGSLSGWRDWPVQWRDPTSPAVAAFAQEHAACVRYHAFTQWLAARGLASAQSAARQAGMGVGLIADLAVGTDPGGSHAWSRQADILDRLSCGAPPDIYNPRGQGWGLTAFSPTAMRDNGYSAFIEMLRAVLAHAGGIRIDHVLALARTWLIPDGALPAEGAYLRYPLQNMLHLVALEAWRHRAVVIGENLGTVPEGFNDTIAQAGMMGMSVLLFERGHAADGRAAPYLPPSNWPASYLATSTTHDLPTLRGWWAERDLDLKVELDLLGPEETITGLRAERASDRQAMHDTLNPEAAGTPPEQDAPVARMLGFMASGPQPLALIPMEDLLALTEQPNVPGTVDSHPNWRRRLPADAQTALSTPEARQALAALNAHRSFE